MYTVASFRNLLLLASAAVLVGAASAQTYDAYGQPRVTASVTASAPAPHRAVYRAPVRRRARTRTTVVVRRRPFGHSVAIVGGSALAGAGVGALVGGPTGAIAGALTGGVGGLIYDRKTHHKRVVVRRRTRAVSSR